MSETAGTALAMPAGACPLDAACGLCRRHSAKRHDLAGCVFVSTHMSYQFRVIDQSHTAGYQAAAKDLINALRDSVSFDLSGGGEREVRQCQWRPKGSQLCYLTQKAMQGGKPS